MDVGHALLMASAGAAAGGAGAEAVDFDGTNDELTRSSDFTGNADGKTFVFSGWVYRVGSPSSVVLYKTGPNSTTRRFDIDIGTTGTLFFQARNSAGTIILNVAASGTTVPLLNWTHLLIAVDLTNSSNRSVYVNDVAESVFRAATTSGLHGKNYILSSESWTMSDLSLMLNKKQPEGQPRIVYSNELATRELGVDFNPANVPLGQFS